MLVIRHLRNRIDELNFHAEQTQDAAERLRLHQQCLELERSIQMREDELRGEMAEIESAKVQLHRLRARL